MGLRKGENEGWDGFVEVLKLNLGEEERGEVIVRILFLQFQEIFRSGCCSSLESLIAFRDKLGNRFWKWRFDRIMGWS